MKSALQPDPDQQLQVVLQDAIDHAAGAWLESALQTLSTSNDINELGLYSAMARRKIGNAQLETNPSLDTPFGSLSLHGWPLADLVRLRLIMRYMQANSGTQDSILKAYYRMGDEAEKIVLIRALILFAPDDAVLDIALDAGRCNSLNILSALNIDNPFPARFYPQPAFNQMVLKALFTGLPISRIVGLEHCANDDLTRMCESYVIERELANRDVPVDIWLAIGTHATPQGKAKMLEYLAHENPRHRMYAGQTLCKLIGGDAGIRSAIEQQLRTEKDTNVGSLLLSCLDRV